MKSPFARILAALIGGAVIGAVFGKTEISGTPLTDIAAPFGTMFIRLLRMSATPTIFFSLITAAASNPPSSLGRIGIKTMGVYLLTAILASAVALGIANTIPFGVSLPQISGSAASVPELRPVSLKDTILNIVPLNPFQALGSENILQVIFFAVASGIALSFLRVSDSEEKRVKGETIFRFCSGVSEIMFILIRWIMKYAPVGVFALSVDAFGRNGADVLLPLSRFIGTAYAAFAFQICVVYALLLKAAGWNVVEFFKQSRDVMLTAFVTRSSGATLPVALETAKDKLHIPESVASFSLPLGATVNMNGVTIQQCLSVFFIAAAAGVSLDAGQQLTVVSVILLASIGTAGIPGGAVIMLLAVLDSVGLSPVEGSAASFAYAMLLGIDALLDMGQTCLNVTGDMVCAAVVGKTEPAEHSETAKDKQP